jgi:hypothetical protein
MLRVIPCLFALVLIAVVGFAQLDGSYTMPLDNEAINYAKAPVTDRVYKLKLELEAGKRKLDYDPDLGSR